MTQAAKTNSPDAGPDANSPGEAQTVEDRSTQFVPVEGGQQTTSAEALLITAYALMWLVVFVFVWLTARRQKALHDRLDHIERALSDHDQPAGPGEA